MLFGDIDWNRVMMQGLIGGIIGGVVGLAVFLFKKASGGGKGGSDDESREGKGGA
jgi:hypothetical protein